MTPSEIKPATFLVVAQHQKIENYGKRHQGVYWHEKWPSKEEREKVISGIHLRIHYHFMLKNASDKNVLLLRASYFSYKN